jgi:peptidoglycan/LPS O-acetylase OafA/YrhL
MNLNIREGQSESLQYRPDIDGLRAIAVILVVLYHANLPIISGGYIGVDVFFVISGYLITKLLIFEINQDKFSFSAFYLRRIRRLAPAAFTVLAASSAWFSYWLYPQEYQDFGRSLLAVLTLSSNWFFFQEVGYFTPAAEVQPLLHTWSLGIEEQFYLIFPILLIALYKRFSKKVILIVIIALAFASFFCSYYFLIVAKQPEAAFFNSWARFWEILAGCSLALVESFNIKNMKTFANGVASKSTVVSLIGFLLILYPAFYYNKQTIFPGWSAVPVIIGTLLLLVTGSSSLIGKLLSFAPLRYIGQISYGLYLWHWPIFISIQSIMPMSDNWIYWALVVSIIFSVLTFQFVEQPIRQRKIYMQTRELLKAYFVSCLLIGFVVFSAINLNSNYSRSKFFRGEIGEVMSHIHHERQLYMDKIDQSFNGKSSSYSEVAYNQLPCSYDNNNSLKRLDICLQKSFAEPSYLVIGDSIGRDTFFALKKAFPSNRFTMLHQSSCIPVDFKNIVGKSCFTQFFNLIEVLVRQKKISGIILASRVFPEEVFDYVHGIKKIESFGVPLLVIAGVPSFLDGIGNYVVKRFNANKIIPTDVDVGDFSMYRSGQDQTVTRLRTDLGAVPVIDSYGIRCDNRRCPLFIGNDIAKPMIFDREHLTLAGIEWLSLRFSQNESLKKFLFSY